MDIAPTEHDVRIQSGNITLAATLSTPDTQGNYPIVLMIHGSGPLDRNENIKGFPLNVFSTIATYLAEQGIASLRYDKRGCGKSNGNYLSAGHRDLVNDADACITYLFSRDDIDKAHVYALGHSEGTVIAPQLSPLHPQLAGIILLAPFLQNINELLYTQAKHIEHSMRELRGVKGFFSRFLLRFNAFNPTVQQGRIIRRLSETENDVIRFRMKKLNAKWLREMMQLNLHAIFNRVACPALLIGGEKDIQCAPGDVALIKEILSSPSEAHVLPNLTHILRYDEEDATFFRYSALIKKPMENDVLEIIASWLNKQFHNR